MGASNLRQRIRIEFSVKSIQIASDTMILYQWKCWSSYEKLFWKRKKIWSEKWILHQGIASALWINFLWNLLEKWVIYFIPRSFAYFQNRNLSSSVTDLLTALISSNAWLHYWMLIQKTSSTNISNNSIIISWNAFRGETAMQYYVFCCFK